MFSNNKKISYGPNISNFYEELSDGFFSEEEEKKQKDQLGDKGPSVYDVIERLININQYQILDKFDDSLPGIPSIYIVDFANNSAFSTKKLLEKL